MVILNYSIAEDYHENEIVTEMEVFDILYGRKVAERKPLERQDIKNMSHNETKYNTEVMKTQLQINESTTMTYRGRSR